MPKPSWRRLGLTRNVPNLQRCRVPDADQAAIEPNGGLRGVSRLTAVTALTQRSN
jgi:hypothetical protein